MQVPCWLVTCNNSGVGTGLLSAAGDVFDVGAAGKGAAGISHGVSGILQSARRGAASDAASDMAGLLWQQWMLGENSELSQMRRAMLAAGLTEEEAAFQMAWPLPAASAQTPRKAPSRQACPTPSAAGCAARRTGSRNERTGKRRAGP